MTNNNRKQKDLKAPIPEHILQLQERPSGTSLILEMDGVLTPFFYDDDLFLATRMSNRLKAEQGWFEKLIKHSPSVGTFYEDSLRNLLAEVLPSRLKIGTGFVFDHEHRKNSKQIDILVYDDSFEAPMYRNGDFVVIKPHMARSLSEVKKTLILNDVRQLIQSTLFLNFGTHFDGFHNSGKFLIFSYSSKIKTNKLFDIIVNEITKKLKSLELECLDGSIATFFVYSIVLPSFYFLDRNDYIESNLTITKNEKIKIEITQFLSGNDKNKTDSLNEYIGEMIDDAESRKKIETRDFRTIPIRKIIHRKIIDIELNLFRRISMDKVLKMFPSDADEIRLFKINGKRPYELQIPIQINPEKFKKFDDLVNCQSISWQCFQK